MGNNVDVFAPNAEGFDANQGQANRKYVTTSSLTDARPKTKTKSKSNSP
jgi:hypothetical protein